MEGLYRAVAFSKRPTAPKVPLVVSHEVFDAITLGEKTRFLDYEGVRIYDESTFDDAQKFLNRKVDEFIMG